MAIYLKVWQHFENIVFTDILKHASARCTPEYCKWHPGSEPLGNVKEVDAGTGIFGRNQHESFALVINQLLQKRNRRLISERIICMFKQLSEENSQMSNSPMQAVHSWVKQPQLMLQVKTKIKQNKYLVLLFRLEFLLYIGVYTTAVSDVLHTKTCYFAGSDFLMANAFPKSLWIVPHSTIGHDVALPSTLNDSFACLHMIIVLHVCTWL